jgi:hypothetical protein
MTDAERANLLSPIDAAAILQGYRDGLFTEQRLAALLANYASVQGLATEAAPAKDLAIKLAVGELERSTHYVNADVRRDEAEAVIRNLLIGLGCEAVVKAWEEVR